MIKLECPVCKRRLYHLERDKNKCYCSYCSHTYQEADLELLDDWISIDIGKNKEWGKCEIIINPNNGVLMFTGKSFLHYYSKAGIYCFDEIQIEVSSSKEMLYKTKGMTPMIIGGLLFGSAGALAGGIIGTGQKSIKEKNNYMISITVESLQFSGLVTETDDANLVHNFVTKMELIRKRISMDEDTEEKKEVIDDSNDDSNETIYEKLVNLKKLYDEGIIDQETYNAKKKKYIDLL